MFFDVVLFCGFIFFDDPTQSVVLKMGTWESGVTSQVERIAQPRIVAVNYAICSWISQLNSS